MPGPAPGQPPDDLEAALGRLDEPPPLILPGQLAFDELDPFPPPCGTPEILPAYLNCP